MNIEEEKLIAKEFFKTLIGKECLKKLNYAKQNEKEILLLSKKIQVLEEQLSHFKLPNVNIQEEQELRGLLEEATSLFKTEKCPRYLYSITLPNGKLDNVYTGDIDDIMKTPTNIYKEEYYG